MRTPLARTFKLTALLAAAIASGPSPAHAYRTLADVEGSPTPIVWEAPPAVARDPEGLTEEQAAQFAAELTASIETWNAAACAGDVLSLAVEGEALVTVGQVPDWAERGFNPTAAGTTHVVLASTMSGDVRRLRVGNRRDANGSPERDSSVRSSVLSIGTTTSVVEQARSALTATLSSQQHLIDYRPSERSY